MSANAKNLLSRFENLVSRELLSIFCVKPSETPAMSSSSECPRAKVRISP